ncbi:L-tyrosine 3-hydroxylase [Streptomyces albus subsp. chlorinus]|uniref:L-tyrosine 3-hydroxylase n=1 Tax=Streptomyces albus TaxID=1888 RepID=UPI001570ED16|nr:L-tyrosine 3-hydroxylase [Streptomyces albus]NSC25605.1 L-tyrosine 3-hydroxylase [Streptomyces albus subsp. chlorinus]
MNDGRREPGTGPGRARAPQLQLRPLFLPPPGREFGPGRGEDPDDGAMEPEVPEYNVFGAHPVETERLFWYRWILGHQVAFALWRAMYEIIGDRRERMPSPPQLDSLTACVDAYSAMLLYASTVPRAHYHSHIRHRMMLHHPAFSGTWAPDYRPVRRLFRGRLPWQGDPSCQALRAALARNTEAHEYIAGHLVADGRSLLRQSVQAANLTVLRDKEELYDNFFLTVRRPISRVEFLRHLRERAAEVGADLAHNGLYPNVGGHHHPVVTGPSGAVLITFVPGVLRVLDKATRLVAGQQLAGVGV